MESATAHGKNESRLGVLDAFRAIAILAVLAHHYLSRYAPPDHFPSLYGYARQYPQWIDLGAMGVQFFFIISGFVIFMTLQSCNHLLEFWIRRFARLYPAFVIATLLTFVIVNLWGPAEFHSHLSDALVGLTFFTPYVPGVRFVEPAYWSLVVEVQFYICIGLIYTVARQRFELAWIGYICCGCALWVAGMLPHLYVLGSLSRVLFLALHAPYFTAGILFYKLYTGSRRMVGLMAAAALLEYLIATPRFTLAQHLVSAAMLAAFTLFIHGRIEWLASRVLLFIGSISYSLYLLHQYIGVTLIGILKRELQLSDLAAVIGATAICCALAYGLWQLVEIPAKRWLLRTARVHFFPRLAARYPLLEFGSTLPLPAGSRSGLRCPPASL